MRLTDLRARVVSAIRRRTPQGVRTAAGLIRLSAITLRGRHALPYLGWVGEQNLGDDIIFESHKRAFEGVRLAILPRTIPPHLSNHTRRLQLTTPRAILLGGGTVIGRRECYEPLDIFFKLWPDAVPIMLGVGVEDPAFRGRRAYTSMDDLLLWRPLLLRFDRITVRGPRSKELLQSVDLDAEVVGDPALMLPAPARTEPRDVIGLNVSEPEDAWGGSLREARAELLAALKEVARRHQTEFRFVVYNPSDYPVSSWFAGELGSLATIVAPRNGAAAQQAVAGCQIFIGERLHSLVMAASAGVPTLALEYRPKCLDFQSSIGLESLSLRTDQLHRGLVVDAIDYAVEERSRLSASMTIKIAELRTRLLHAQERNLQISRGTRVMPIRGLE